MRLTVDFETFSELNIKRVGGYRYASHSSTEALMLAWKIDDGETQIWDITEDRQWPWTLWHALSLDSTTIHAFNAQFERLIFKHCLGLDIPASRFRCSMVRAYSLSFAGGLDDVLKQFVPGYRKDPRGDKLISKFSKPQPKNQNVERWTRENDPEGWEEFKRYCIQDVEVEYQLAQKLEAYPYLDSEQELYALDQKINDAGVPVDTDLINAAIEISSKEKARLKKKLQELTGLANPNSNPQFLPWLQMNFVWAEDMQKDTVTALLERDDLTPLVREALVLKQQLAKTSATKYNAFARCVGDDGRVRGMFQFAGAQRTSRWAGRIIQLHNLARGGATTRDPGTLADVMVAGGHEAVRALYDKPMIALSDAIRCCITSSDG